MIKYFFVKNIAFESETLFASLVLLLAAAVAASEGGISINSSIIRNCLLEDSQGQILSAKVRREANCSDVV